MEWHHAEESDSKDVFNKTFLASYFITAKYSVQTTSSVQSIKILLKLYLRVFKKFKTMHTNSAYVDVHCHKIWDSNSFSKNTYEITNFICICTRWRILSSSAYGNEICYFHTHFFKTSLNLKFCEKCTSTYALLVCIVLNFLKIHKYDFAKGFHDCTKDVVCTEYFAFYYMEKREHPKPGR